VFVGHYGVSFAAKAARRDIPLWVLFLAVQLLDVFWSIFVLVGIEKVRIVPGITRLSPLDLYYMPYTHGLLTSLGWSVLAAVLYHAWRKKDGWAPAMIVGAAVFSHWILDLLVHRPDLPIFADRYKVGFGLWNYPAIESTLEVLVLLAGLYLYMRSTKPVARAGRYAMVVFTIVMLAIHAASYIGPPPSEAPAEAVLAFVAYAAFAAVAGRLDRLRA
jgi:hypothetical protein